MKQILLTLLAIMPISMIAQNMQNEKYIEVRGSAKKEVKPDEMVLSLGIEEYWKEEFEKKRGPNDYKTKVPLAQIEESLIKSLRIIGIKKDDIKVKGVGNYWREQGKEFLFNKQFEVKITDFSKVNRLSAIADAKGIKYMHVGQMGHSNIKELQQQVRVDAVKNAREKAALLAESAGSSLGEVLSISEITDDFSRPYLAKNQLMAASADASFEAIDQVQDITISYQVIVKYRLK